MVLHGLTKNLELNGQGGVVVPQEMSVWPEVPGCMKVRLDSGQEVAVKAGNLSLVAPPSEARASPQELALQAALAQAKAEAGSSI